MTLRKELELIDQLAERITGILQGFNGLVTTVERVETIFRQHHFTVESVVGADKGYSVLLLRHVDQGPVIRVEMLVGPEKSNFACYVHQRDKMH